MRQQRKWSDTEIQLLRELREHNYSMPEIARRLGRTLEAVVGYTNRSGIGAEHPRQPGAPPRDSRPDQPKVSLKDINALFPKLTDFLKVKEKDVMIISDLHLPYLNVPLWEKCKKTAKQEKIKALIVAGDISNQDSYSVYTSASGPGSFKKEKDIIEDWFVDALDTFEKIYCIMGNHDLRFFKMLNGELQAPDWFKIFTDQVSKRVFISSEFRFLRLNGIIDVSHPKQYWQNAPSLAKRFNSKYLRHQIIGHSHHFGMGFDISGQFWCVEMPSLVDQERCEYSAICLDTHPRWQNGFITIRNYQYPEIYVDGITDWRKVSK